MKTKIISVFICMLLCATIPLVAGNENEGTGIISLKNSMPILDPGDIVVDFDAQTIHGETGSLGCEWDGEYFWSTCRGLTTPPHDLYKWDINGNLIATYDQPAQSSSWGIRDLAFDGTYLYGGSENGFWQIDPSDGSNTLLFSSIAPMTCIRALAWEPNEQKFYSGNFGSSFYKFSADGSDITAVTNPGLTAVYGMAYDDFADTIWIFDQTGTPQTTLLEFDHHTQTLTGDSYVVPLLSGSTAQLAGGCFYAEDVTGFVGTAIIGGMVQGTPVDRIFCLDNGEVSPPAIPDLDCVGELDFIDVEPNGTITGTITVENIGEPDSELSWEILSYPDWGTFTFDPESGTGLLEGDSVDIDVTIVAPDVEEETFEGEVVLVNSEDNTDTCTILVSVVTPVSQSYPFLDLLAQRFPILAKILAMIL